MFICIDQVNPSVPQIPPSLKPNCFLWTVVNQDFSPMKSKRSISHCGCFRSTMRISFGSTLCITRILCTHMHVYLHSGHQVSALLLLSKCFATGLHTFQPVVCSTRLQIIYQDLQVKPIILEKRILSLLLGRDLKRLGQTYQRPFPLYPVGTSYSQLLMGPDRELLKGAGSSQSSQQRLN